MDVEREEDSGAASAAFSQNGLSDASWRRLSAASGPQARCCGGLRGVGAAAILVGWYNRWTFCRRGRRWVVLPLGARRAAAWAPWNLKNSGEAVLEFWPQA